MQGVIESRWQIQDGGSQKVSIVFFIMPDDSIDFENNFISGCAPIGECYVVAQFT